MFGTVTSEVSKSSYVQLDLVLYAGIIVLAIVAICVRLIVSFAFGKTTKIIAAVVMICTIAVFIFAAAADIKKTQNHINNSINQYEEAVSESHENIGKAINDKFPGAEMLSDVSSSGSFKYKEEFYKYKVETNVLYIECYSDSNINNVIISGKDY